LLGEGYGTIGSVGAGGILLLALGVDVLMGWMGSDRENKQ